MDLVVVTTIFHHHILIWEFKVSHHLLLRVHDMIDEFLDLLFVVLNKLLWCLFTFMEFQEVFLWYMKIGFVNIGRLVHQRSQQCFFDIGCSLWKKLACSLSSRQHMHIPSPRWLSKLVMWLLYLLISLLEVLLTGMKSLTVKYLWVHFHCSARLHGFFKWDGILQGCLLRLKVCSTILGLCMRSRILARNVIIRENFTQVIDIFIHIDSREARKSGSHLTLLASIVGSWASFVT